jgi:hypothetical protein
VPILKNNLEDHAIAGSHYGFSAKRLMDLGAADYTLVVLSADNSGSVAPFLGDIEECIKDVVLACYRSPRADNVMFRLTRFDDELEEVHGFKPIPECHPADYDHCLKSGGMTALYDATHNAVAAIGAYGRNLAHHNFDVNGIVFIATDGADNASSETAVSVRKTVEKVLSEESLESLITVLVGVNVTDGSMSDYLTNFARDANFDHYIEIDEANEKKLAKLGAFVSASIATQSVALGSGMKPTLLKF